MYRRHPVAVLNGDRRMRRQDAADTGELVFDGCSVSVLTGRRHHDAPSIQARSAQRWVSPEVASSSPSLAFQAYMVFDQQLCELSTRIDGESRV